MVNCVAHRLGFLSPVFIHGYRLLGCVPTTVNAVEPAAIPPILPKFHHFTKPLMLQWNMSRTEFKLVVAEILNVQLFATSVMVVRTVNPFAHYITRLYSGYTPCLLVTPHLVIKELPHCRQNYGPPDPMSWIRIHPHLATMDAWQEWRGVDCQYAGLLKPPFPDSSKRFLPFVRKSGGFHQERWGI